MTDLAMQRIGATDWYMDEGEILTVITVSHP